MNNSDSEIDLFNLLLKLLKFIKKSKKVIIAFFLFGIIIGGINYFRKASDNKIVYEKTYLAESAIMSNEVIVSIINSIGLKNEFPDNDLVLLSNKLSLSMPVVQSIKNISAELQSTSSESSVIKLKIEWSDQNNIDSLIYGITHYINSIEYVKKRYDIDRKQQAQLILILNNKINHYDEALGLNKISDSEKLLKQIVGKNEVLNYMELIDRKQKLEKQISLLNSIEFIASSEAKIISRPKISLELFKIIAFGILGAFMAVSFIFFFGIYNKVRDQLNKPS
jgi:hypothetical protein